MSFQPVTVDAQELNMTRHAANDTERLSTNIIPKVVTLGKVLRTPGVHAS
jgi:hypothetical protein